MQATRVLLIEDDAVFQSVVRQFLTQRGYEVRVVDDGEAGLEACASNEPDVVLCDLLLPRMSGLDVLETLVSRNQDIPVIVISASEQMSHIREAVRLGAWDYLVKPVHDLELLDFAIHNCLDRHRLEEAHEREVWELDSHIDVLYQDEDVVSRLTNDLIPNGDLDSGEYRIAHDFGEQSPERLLLDYRQLTEGKVLVVMATANGVAGQTLISLLVLKTLINPLVRQALAGTDKLLFHPAELLAHLNSELCHSKIRTAYDVVIGILDTHEHEFAWAQAGERIELSHPVKSDLSLGIWQQAQFRTHRQPIVAGEMFTLCFNDARLRLQRYQTAA